jgi:polar amino acid transport system substrate-binding protein
VKSHRLVPIALAMMIFMAFATPLAAGDQVVKVSSDPWPPFVEGKEGEAPSGGVAVAVTEELFKRLNLETDIMIYPYKRCIRQMKTGERDLLLMVKKTKEREKFMLFSDVVMVDSQLIYYSSERLDEFEWDRWDDLKSHTFGLVLGFDYGGFEEVIGKHQIETQRVENNLQNIKKVISGRVDMTILTRSNFYHYISQHPELRGKMKAAAKAVDKSEFHFALSKKGRFASYLPTINETLRAMKADGTLKQLLKELNGE